MEELIQQLDEHLHYDGHENQGEELFIYVNSLRGTVNCSYCGQPSGQIHSRKVRTLKDLPIQGKKVKLLLDQRKFFCKNKDCDRTTFAERFDFFEPKATKTNRLQNEMLRVALTQSSVAASRYLRNSVAAVGKSTICNLLKKGIKTDVEKARVISVCIDDFALKKRTRYGTVMVNVETHKIVDMIESREATDVSRWLAEYPNLCVVSRDGSQQYAAAITAAHPGAMQISDRFHLLKNLNDRATDAFQKLFQGRIAIPITSGTQNIRYDILIDTKADRIRLVKKLRSEGRSKRGNRSADRVIGSHGQKVY